MYVLKVFLKQKVRLVLTIGGIALCATLMLFILAIYRGVAVGSLEYIKSSGADLWVMQKHASNILRSTSILHSATGRTIEHIPEVESADPVLFIMAAAETANGPATLYLTGYDVESGAGGPPRIAAGRGLRQDDEIVLDQAYAAKNGVHIGDEIRINEDALTVVGLSSGTNMFVIQYAFISLRAAYSIVGFSNVATCFQVSLQEGANIAGVAAQIQENVAGVRVYDHATFLENNTREMESGILPLLYMIALISTVVLSAILSLILTVSVLERRQEFAIMKAIGSPDRFISGMVIKEALLFAAVGLVVAMILFFPLMSAVRKAAPEISPVTTGQHVLYVAVGVAVVGLVSTIIPNQRLRGIYPIEVFQ